MKERRAVILAASLAFGLIFPSCSVVQELGQAVTSLSRCTFKLDGVADFRLAGVSLSGKSRLAPLDAAMVLGAFSKGELPASFTLNVAARNPNTTPGAATRGAATMTRFSWTLLLDGTPTITGEIAKPIEIPGSGEQTLIPLRMNLDLVRFFKNQGYDKLLSLALALGGAQGSASRVTLRARPTISTPLGPITYPGELEIVDREFRGD